MTVRFSRDCCGTGAFGGAKPIAGQVFARKPLLVDTPDQSEEDFLQQSPQDSPLEGQKLRNIRASVAGSAGDDNSDLR